VNGLKDSEQTVLEKNTELPDSAKSSDATKLPVLLLKRREIWLYEFFALLCYLLQLAGA